MSPKSTTYHHGDLRRRLIRTAEDLIAKQGVEAVTMRMLSRQIGVSHTAAYRHFRDKQALLCALAQNGFTALAQKFQELAPELQNKPLALIRAQGKVYIDFALENPARYRIMFGHVLINHRDRDQLNQAVRQAFAHLLQAIEQGQRTGDIRPGSPLELASVNWSMVHGLSQSAIDGQLLPSLMNVSGKPTEQELTRLTSLVLDTLVAGLVPKDEETMQRIVKKIWS